MRTGGLLLILLLLTGCAAPVVQPPDGSASGCRQYFAALDRAVDRAGVRDEGPRPVPGFPYLRVDRLLASFRGEVEAEARFSAWVERLARLDREARRYEIRNLPAAERRRLGALLPAGQELLAATEECRQRLLARELVLPGNRDRLRVRARVADDYVTAWRILGLYPLSALFVKAGIAVWHRETAERYALPLAALPQLGKPRVWRAPAAWRLKPAEVAALLRASAGNPLAIPEPDPAQRAALFTTFAPQWQIDTVDDDDLPGTPRFASGSARPRVDTTRPAVFRRISHTRFGGQVLLQLNYIVWFRARPPASRCDLYAGALDGINFRVTLGSDGRPLLFDAIHNCGCYHKFFPVTPLTRSRAVRGFWTEPPLVPQFIEAVGDVPVLHVASRTHYLQRISFATRPGGEVYRWDDYAGLRSLATGSGRRSLFGEHGIIGASARPERILLWPMGIRSPGAMRQWGRHPTAFIGRRHFDDPYLVERLFRLEPGEETP